jgi:hypothetical protein
MCNVRFSFSDCMNKKLLHHVTATLHVLICYEKSVALNVGGTLGNLTGNAMERSGRAIIWDNVPGGFLELLRKISGKVIHNCSPDLALNLGYSGIGNMIPTCLHVTDENSLTCFCIPAVAQFGDE